METSLGMQPQRDKANNARRNEMKKGKNGIRQRTESRENVREKFISLSESSQAGDYPPGCEREGSEENTTIHALGWMCEESMHPEFPLLEACLMSHQSRPNSLEQIQVG